MVENLKILYANMGGVVPYSCDKTAGRVLGWAKEGNDVFLLAPELIKETAQKEIRDISSAPEKIKIFSLPFTKRHTTSSFGIIFSYFLRILFSPVVLFKKIPKFDFGFSNSAVLVDTIPILILKLFGKCRNWILMMDSVIPPPGQRSGNRFINIITFWEFKLISRIANRFASVVFTVNPELKKEIIKNGIMERKIFLTQNGLFMNRIDGVPNQERNRYDAVYMGRVTENKGIFDLLQVWSEVLKAAPRARLAILGTGRAEVVNDFTDKIRHNKLERNVEYLGYVRGDIKYEIFKSSKVFIFLSKVNADESWGISLMEALACGLTAVTYDLAIYKHVYQEGVLLKSEIGDIDSVVKKILFLLKNEYERVALSTKSIQFSRQFNWLEIAGKDLEVINAIIK